MIRRRELNTLLAGAAAWPVAARAQQGDPIRRIGILQLGSSGTTGRVPAGLPSRSTLVAPSLQADRYAERLQ